jgi:hypothetical protein
MPWSPKVAFFLQRVLVKHAEGTFLNLLGLQNVGAARLDGLHVDLDTKDAWSVQRHPGASHQWQVRDPQDPAHVQRRPNELRPLFHGSQLKPVVALERLEPSWAFGSDLACGALDALLRGAPSLRELALEPGLRAVDRSSFHAIGARATQFSRFRFATAYIKLQEWYRVLDLVETMPLESLCLHEESACRQERMPIDSARLLQLLRDKGATLTSLTFEVVCLTCAHVKILTKALPTLTHFAIDCDPQAVETANLHCKHPLTRACDHALQSSASVHEPSGSQSYPVE